jgi:glutamate racemase
MNTVPSAPDLMGRMKITKVGLLFITILVISCRGDDRDIINTILGDKESFYYVDFNSYPDDDKTLPIGIFDSGTGGLTVLKSILNFDRYQNETHTGGSDGSRDFVNESFIYFGDLANMPYGNYAGEDNIDLLKEHIIKDAQFLLGNKYYTDDNDIEANIDKREVKAIVIGCNTATAYGKNHIEEFIKRAGIELKVIGVIDAGVEGALDCLTKDEDAIIGVMATSGTVSSKGYENAIIDLKEEEKFTGNIEIFSQGGIGIAEAVDGDADYFQKNAVEPHEDYKGPGLSGENVINKSLLEAYNFDFSGGKMLCDNENVDECTIMQINDAENYVRFHLVSLMEQIRRSHTNNKLKVIILGCTHYPYLSGEIEKVLGELFDFKTADGKYLYRQFMVQNIELIDPAENTAKELYEYMIKHFLFNPDGDILESEFYISIPNRDNRHVRLDQAGRFPYDYKYGRKAGEFQEYVKVVPFSRQNLADDVLSRIQEQMPYLYMLIQHFNEKNQKTSSLPAADRI